MLSTPSTAYRVSADPSVAMAPLKYKDTWNHGYWFISAFHLHKTVFKTIIFVRRVLHSLKYNAEHLQTINDTTRTLMCSQKCVVIVTTFISGSSDWKTFLKYDFKMISCYLCSLDQVFKMHVLSLLENINNWNLKSEPVWKLDFCCLSAENRTEFRRQLYWKSCRGLLPGDSFDWHVITANPQQDNSDKRICPLFTHMSFKTCVSLFLSIKWKVQCPDNNLLFILFSH